VFSVSAQTATERFQRGKEAVDAKNYGTAIREYSAYLELRPNDSRAYYNRGIAYKETNQLELALADYTKSIELDPKFVKAYVNRSLVYSSLGKPNLALADNDRAIEMSPNEASYYFNRGLLHAQQTRKELALKDFDTAIRLNDKSAKYYARRADLHSGLKNWAAANADFYMAIRLDPSLHTHYYPLAWMEMHVGNDKAAYENAVKYLEGKGMDTNRAGWTLVAGYLAMLRAGNDLEAERFVTRFPADKTPGVLPAKILDFLRGNLTETDLLTEAGDDQMKLTDTHGMIGLKYLAEGKKEAALPHLRWVKEKGRTTPGVFALAVIELDRLESLPSK